MTGIVTPDMGERRTILAIDTATSRVAIVNGALARQLFPGRAHTREQ